MKEENKLTQKILDQKLTELSSSTETTPKIYGEILLLIQSAVQNDLEVYALGHEDKEHPNAARLAALPGKSNDPLHDRILMVFSDKSLTDGYREAKSGSSSASLSLAACSVPWRTVIGMLLDIPAYTGLFLNPAPHDNSHLVYLPKAAIRKMFRPTEEEKKDLEERIRKSHEEKGKTN